MMSPILTRHATPDGPRWACDGAWLPSTWLLGDLLSLPTIEIAASLAGVPRAGAASAPLIAPLDDEHEVWASGVTYLSSRMAREAESQSSDVYGRVYDAARPELFFKSVGWRARGHGQSIRIRADSAWNVPEPELVLVLDAAGEIVGFTAGNDVSSRSIEGENPLYLPQAKIYDGACALGPGLHLCAPGHARDLLVALSILRRDAAAFEGSTRTSQIKRPLEELAAYLYRDLSFPRGALLFTGTGIVPDETFTLQSGDVVRIEIGGLVLENFVE